METRFLAVPDPKLAEEHLRILTQAPHIAGSPEDKATADYVAKKFREAGLETEIVEYRVWMNYPTGNQRRCDRSCWCHYAWPNPRAGERRPLRRRSSGSDAVQRHVALWRRGSRCGLRELRLA